MLVRAADVPLAMFALLALDSVSRRFVFAKAED
jgi:hypothetical protein